MFHSFRPRLVAILSGMAIAAAVVIFSESIDNQLASYFLVSSDRQPLPEDLYEAPGGLTYRLMPSSVDKKTGKPLYSVDSSKDLYRNHVHIASFLTNKNGSTRDVYFQGHDDTDDAIEDGNSDDKMAFAKDFYATDSVEANDARPSGRRLQGLTIYARDGKTIFSEKFYRLDGSCRLTGHLLANGQFQTFDLFADGYTAESETLTVPEKYGKNNAPKVLLERHWREPSEGHILKSSKALMEDDTVSVQEFDAHEHLILDRHNGRWGANGTSIQAYYPNSGVMRVNSQTTYVSTDATYFRFDSTRERELSIDESSVHVTAFDLTGKIPLYRQTFWIRNRLQDGQKKTSFVLWQIEELNPAGKVTRDIDFKDGELWHVTVFLDPSDSSAHRLQLTFRPDGTLETEEKYTDGE